MEWVEFLAAIALGLATMYSVRGATKRAMRRLPRHSDVAASGAAGLTLAAIFAIGNRLPLLVLFPLITAVMGVYVGVLLSGSGWRHSRVVSSGLLRCAVGCLRCTALDLVARVIADIERPASPSCVKRA